MSAPYVPTDAETAAALDIARALAAAGVPVFVARPDASRSTGYVEPTGWQQIKADPGVVDLWRPGMAIAAVMGQGLDGVDVDPRNGGDVAALNGAMPTVYGVASTPSGGTHHFIKSLGVRKTKRDGIDLQAGDAEGEGRGFVFLAPTVRKSKVTGQPAPYRWTVPLNVNTAVREFATDTSGGALREWFASVSPPAGGLDVGVIVAEGAPIGDQDNELSRLAWRCRQVGMAEADTREVWQAAVERCETGGDPWTEDDFQRHWRSADAKLGAHLDADDAAWAKLGVDVDALRAQLPPRGEAPAVGQTPAPRSRLHDQVLSLDALRGDPPPTAPYVLDGMVREGDNVALTSEAKAGKSLLVLELVLRAVAAGRCVVYLDAENGLRDIHTRVSALGYSDDLKDGLVYVSFPSLALDTPSGAAELVAFVSELHAARPVDLVVLDTASRYLAGKENDSEPWLAMYRAAFLPLKRTGIAVLRLDHLGKDATRGARGSSAKQGDVDAEFELTAAEAKAPGTARIELACTMQRSGTYERHTVLIRSTIGGVLGHRHPGDAVGTTIVGDPGDVASGIVRALDTSNAPIDIGRDKAKTLVGAQFEGATLRTWKEAVARRKGRGALPTVQQNVPKALVVPPGRTRSSDQVGDQVRAGDQPDQVAPEPPESLGQELVAASDQPDQRSTWSGSPPYRGDLATSSGNSTSCKTSAAPYNDVQQALIDRLNPSTQETA